MPQNVGTVSLEATLDLRKATQQYQRFQRQIGQNKRNNLFSGISSDAREFESSLGKATNRVVAFGAAAAIFQTLAKSTSAFANALIDVESNLTKINVNFNESAEGIRKFGAGLFNVARETGQSFDVAAKAAEEFARQGLSAAETLIRVRDALILSRRTGLDATDSVEALTAAVNSFTAEALTSTSVINKLIAVDTRFAVSSKDIAEGIARVGSTSQAAGVGIDELIGLITSLQQTTALGGANIGNGLKSIFTRVQAAPETIAALQSVGVAIKDTEGNLRSATDILKDYANARENVGEVERAALDRTVAGTFQINKLKAALLDISKANGVYARSTREAAGATDQAITQNQKLNDTLESLINQTTVSITQLFSALGERSVGPIFKDLLRSFEDARKFLSGETGSALGKDLGEGILNGLANVINGPALLGLLVILANTFKKVIGTIAQEARSLLAINSAAQARANVQQQINNLLIQANDIERVQIANASTLLQKQEALLAVQARLNAEAAVGTALTRSLVVPSSKGVGYGVDPRFKIPRFADPIGAAIKREVSAGVHPKDVYVDRDARVASFANPMGLLVANKRDEPLGGYQGVNRVLSQGGNPKTSGITPNFAKNPLQTQAQIVAARFGLGDPRYDDGEAGKVKAAKAISSLDAAIARSDAANQAVNEKAKKLANTLSLVDKGFEGLRKQLEQGRVEVISGGNHNASPESIAAYQAGRNAAAGNGRDFSGTFLGSGPSPRPFGPAYPINPDLAARLRTQASARNGIFAGTDYDNPIGPPDQVTFARQRAVQQASLRQRLSGLVDAEIQRKAYAAAQAEQQTLEKAARRSQSNRNISLGAAFALPLAAGFVPEGKGGTTRGQALGAASGALNGAGIGGIFGPGGLAGGAVIGALVGAFNKSTKSVEEFSNELNNATAAQGKSVDATVKVADLFSQLKDNIKNGGSKAAFGRINGQITSEFGNITDTETRQQLLKLTNGSIGDLDENKLADLISQIQEKQARRQAADESSIVSRSQGSDDFLSKLYKVVQYPEKLLGKFGGGLLTGGASNSLAALGRYNERNYQQKTDIGEIANDRRALAQSVLPLITADNISKINTKGLQIGGDEATPEQIKNLTDVLSLLGKTVEITDKNYRENAESVLDATKAFRLAKKAEDQRRSTAATGRLAAGSFLNKLDNDAFSRAALTGRSPSANRNSKAQSRFDLFEELKKSGAPEFSDVRLQGNPLYKKSAAGVQSANITDALIKFLQGNNSNVGTLRDERGNANIDSIQTVLEQLSKSGTSNAELAKQLLGLIPALKATLTDAKANVPTGASTNQANFSSGYTLGADYGSFNKISKRAARRLDANGRPILTQVPNAPAFNRNGSVSQATLDKLPSDSQSAQQNDASRDADIASYLQIAKDAKDAAASSAAALQIPLKVVVTVNGLADQDNSTLANAIQSALRTLGVPVPKPLPPVNSKTGIPAGTAQ